MDSISCCCYYYFFFALTVSRNNIFHVKIHPLRIRIFFPSSPLYFLCVVCNYMRRYVCMYYIYINEI